jgi:hypothetical protein
LECCLGLVSDLLQIGKGILLVAPAVLGMAALPGTVAAYTCAGDADCVGTLVCKLLAT